MMQQTNQYKLNLIESGDHFSPAPLNENTQKVEDVLKNHSDALTTLQAQHAQDITALQTQLAQDIGTLTASALKIATGSYTGTNTYGSSNKNTLTFDFTPKLVYVVGDTYYSFFIYGAKYGLGGFGGGGDPHRYVQTATWSDNTLSWFCSKVNTSSGGSGAITAVTQLNSSSVTYSYIAIG